MIPRDPGDARDVDARPATDGPLRGARSAGAWKATILLAALCPSASVAAGDWTHWRGPDQLGVSDETGLPDDVTPGGPEARWERAIAGRGTPVIFGGLVYVLGYDGDGADLRQVLLCLDERDGEIRWARRFSDFLTDTTYDRYSIGAPTVDPATGDVFVVTTAGELVAFTGDGRRRWSRALGAEFGRLTFPNDVAADGSGTIRAKAWRRGDPEPEGWNLEFHRARAHASGAPGIHGFAPQSRFRVYLDNLEVRPADPHDGPGDVRRRSRNARSFHDVSTAASPGAGPDRYHER